MDEDKTLLDELFADIPIAELPDRQCLSADTDDDGKSEIFQRLAALGLRRFVIEYDGFGDQGNFSSAVGVDTDGEEVGIPSATVNWVEEFVALTLPVGWEFEGGSYGTVTFDVAAGRVRYEHTERMIVEKDQVWEA